MKTRFKAVRAVATVAILLVALALAGCAAGEASGPSAVVQKALELRRDRVSDAKGYTPLFADPDIAAQLAKDSKAATQAPIPEWSTPYVSSEASSTAEVVVVWKPTTEPRFKGWPKATVFSLEQTRSVWVIVDAQEASGTLPPAKGATKP